MNISKLVQKLLAPIVSLVLEFLIKQVDDDDCVAYGFKLGSWVTDNCKDLMGGSWEKVESQIQKKSDKFINEGIRMGLDYDDKE